MVNGKMGMFYGMKGSKVTVKFPDGQKDVSAKDVEIPDLMMDDVEKDSDDPCWAGYVQLGTKMKNGKEVPNCVPMEEAKKQMNERLLNEIPSEDKLVDMLLRDQDRGGTGEKIIKSLVDRLSDKQIKWVVKQVGFKPSVGRKDLPKKLADTWSVKRHLDSEDIASVLTRAMKESVNEQTLSEGYYDYPDYGSVGASEMKMTQLHFIKYAADEIIGCLESGCVMPEWYQNKLAKVEGEVEGLLSYMKGKKAKAMSRRYSPGMYAEEVELDENKNLMKDYEKMKSQGKKDSAIIDVLMSMPKYKRMSRDQIAKIIGDAKRKGIFKEEVETLTEAKEGDKEAYRKFFDKALKKFGVKSPAELEGDKEKEFYNYIDKNWKSDKESSGDMSEAYINEVLKPSDDVSKWIEDFYGSDAPQFKGKSKEERREMAVAAWLEARREAGYDVEPNPNE